LKYSELAGGEIKNFEKDEKPPFIKLNIPEERDYDEV
jgi:hypothetical protein